MTISQSSALEEYRLFRSSNEILMMVIIIIIIIFIIQYFLFCDGIPSLSTNAVRFSSKQQTTLSFELTPNWINNNK